MAEEEDHPACWLGRRELMLLSLLYALELQWGWQQPRALTFAETVGKHQVCIPPLSLSLCVSLSDILQAIGTRCLTKYSDFSPVSWWRKFPKEPSPLSSKVFQLEDFSPQCAFTTTFQFYHQLLWSSLHTQPPRPNHVITSSETKRLRVTLWIWNWHFEEWETFLAHFTNPWIEMLWNHIERDTETEHGGWHHCRLVGRDKNLVTPSKMHSAMSLMNVSLGPNWKIIGNTKNRMQRKGFASVVCFVSIYAHSAFVH